MDAAGTATIGSGDERRLTIRAYHHWAGLLRSRACPDVEDCDFLSRPEFTPHVLVLEREREWMIRFVGADLARACGDEQPATLSAVPLSSPLSRVAAACARVPDRQAPLEFASSESSAILYRGILLPFGRNGAIDRLVGVITWKPAAGCLPKSMPEQPRCTASAGAGALVAWADGPLTPAAPHGTDDLALRLRALPAVALADLPARGGAFPLVLARRSDQGKLELLGEVPEEPVLLERAARLLLT